MQYSYAAQKGGSGRSEQATATVDATDLVKYDNRIFEIDPHDFAHSRVDLAQRMQTTQTVRQRGRGVRAATMRGREKPNRL